MNFEKLGNTDYYRITIPGSAILMSKDTANAGASVTVKAFSSFICFANPSSLSLEDDSLGDWYNY